MCLRICIYFFTGINYNILIEFLSSGILIEKTTYKFYNTEEEPTRQDDGEYSCFLQAKLIAPDVLLAVPKRRTFPLFISVAVMERGKCIPSVERHTLVNN